MVSNEWTEENDKLIKDFKFKNFTQAFAWMSGVAIEAEKMQHHPEWKNVYNTVHVEMTTHDQGSVVTEKDHKLAEKMDKLAESFG
jgi:4a-hydroxytetrahydrobiopterin dehydratase